MARRKSHFLAWVFLVYTLSIGLLLLLPVKTNADIHINEGKLSITVSPGTDLNFTLDAGVFNSVTQNFAISTTSAAGYTVTMETEGYDTGTSTIKTTDLVNVADDTIRIPTITVPTPGGTITSSNFTTGYGYSTDAINYRPAPAINATDTLAQTSTANSTPDDRTLTFGGRIGIDTEAGTYSNSFNVQIVANLVPYTVYFDKNGGEGTMLPQAIPEQTATALNLNQFTRDGYDFSGWNTEPDGSGDRYTDGQLVTDLVLPGDSITLYAQWEKVCGPGKICYYDNGANSTTTMGDQTTTGYTSTVNNYTTPITAGAEVTLWPSNYQRSGYGFAGWSMDGDAAAKILDNDSSNDPIIYGPMETITAPDSIATSGVKLYAVWIPSAGTIQSWTGCPSLATGAVTALTDSRDNNTYAIAKLKDGNCWMIENFRLGGTSNITLTHADTDVVDDYVLSGMTPTSANVTASVLMRNHNTLAPVSQLNNMNTNMQIYSYGNQYAGYAAYATATPVYTNNMDNKTSSCPKGWRLPTGGGSANGNEFDTLNNLQNSGSTTSSVGLRAFPVNLIYSGAATDVRINGYDAALRSATYRDHNAPTGRSFDYSLSFSNTSVQTNSIVYGRNIAQGGLRCMARKSYTVHFDANGGSGTMADQTFYINAAGNKLNKNTFTAPTGKGFKEWNTRADGQGTAYQNAEIITTNIANEGETIPLYAIWVDDINSISNMQDMTTELCAQTAIGTETTLKDLRDNKTYFVAKLADGKCWMTQNLDLDLSTETALTSATSDISGTRKSWTPENNTQTIAGTTWASNGSDGTRSFDNGEKYLEDGTGTVQNVNDSISSEQKHYTLGNYYNWPAATAGTGTSAMTSGSATDSICPKGWKLPSSTATTGDFATLLSTYSITNNAAGSIKSLTPPLYFVYSGYYNYSTGQPAYQGTNGYGFWWSPNVASAANAYSFHINSTLANPTYSNTKGQGRSIRCVARDTYTINFDKNGGSGTMPSQIGYRDQATALNANTFVVPTNHSFIGWTTNADGSGDFYADGAAVTNLADAGGSITLYARYAYTLDNAYFDAGKTKLNGYYKLQDITPAICNAVNVYGVDSQATLIDARDNNTYVVRKLADNKCWMVQNLALGGDTAMNLTPETTDITKDFTLEAHMDTNWGGAQNANGTNTNRMYSNGTAWMDGNTKMTSGIPPSATQYMGNYYNWYTATAGTGTYESAANTIASESICPKGWRLPTGGAIDATTGNGEFQALYNAYGDATNFNTAFPTVRVGYWDNNTVRQIGNQSLFYSATTYNAYGVSALWVANSITPNYNGPAKFWGVSVRCVARDTYTIEFDSNGGSGTMPSQIAYLGQDFKLPKNTFTNGNEEFYGWNTNANGSGTAYTDLGTVFNQIMPTGEKITLYAQWGCPAGKICYFDNGANSETKMGDQAATSNTETTLWPSNFKRDGYGFAGWSTDKNVTTASTIYGPMQTLTASEVGDLSTKGKKLYAVWIEAKEDLQNWSGCDALTPASYNSTNGTLVANLSSVTALRDSRDGNAYAVARLADGNCWMIENLRLGNATDIFSLTPQDTDINTNIVLPRSTTTMSNTIAVHSLNTTSTTQKLVDSNAAIYSYGNYYPWAASLGTTTAYNTVGTNVGTSICPKGWSLPIGNNVSTTNRSFSYLDTTIGGTGNSYSGTAGNAQRLKWQSFPFNFLLSGGVNASSINERGTNGRYWSSTSNGSTNAFALALDTLNNNYNLPGTHGNAAKAWGFSVRCIAKDYFKVSYDANGGTGTTKTTAAVIGETATLTDSTFTAPAGKSFVGWNTKADGTGTSYKPGDTITDADTTNHALTLYAQYGLTIEGAYESVGKIKAEGYYALQEMTSEICQKTEALGDAGAAQLIDIRDNKIYTVAKLADNKCWMTSNLRVGNSTATTLDNATSDLNTITSFTLPTSAGGSWQANDVPHMYYYDGNWLDENNILQTTGTPPSEDRYIGNYYDWYAATAGTGKYAMTSGNTNDSICPKGWRMPTGNTTGDFQTLYDAYNNTSDFVNATKVIPSGMYHPINQRIESIGANGFGTWLTSTPYTSGTYVYYMEYRPSTDVVLPSAYQLYRFTGVSVRCVARENYTVKFVANGGAGTMAEQTINAGATVKLSASTFTAPTGKSFVGWNTEANGSGTTYANEQEVTDLGLAGETVTLYAQYAVTLNNITLMQEMTSGICSATPVGTEAVLKDTRDGKTYSVAKLKDGNCWMTENLDHDIDATKTYTPADTDISSNWTPDVSTINIQGLNAGENVSGWVGAFGDNGLASADPGEAYWDGSTNRHSRIGNYYNWTAALAVNDSSAYSNGTETDPSQNPQTSICPKGWRLPIIANENTGHVDEFKELNRLYNNGLNSTDSGLIASPLYFARGGAIDQSSELQGVGDAGSYWSSTAGGPMFVFNTAYYFNHNAGYNDSYSSNIAFGYNIRCVARDNYMVEFDANGGSGTMPTQLVNNGVATKLPANTFTAPAGATFNGWNTEANGSGTSYANEAEITTDLTTAGETVTLYAQWYKPTLADISTMQEMTSDICANTLTPAVNATSVPEKQLRDTRDNKMYWVAKLADGKCWMTQNLDLNLDATKTYTPADTDLVSDWQPIRSTIDATNVTNRIVPGFEFVTDSPYSVDPGNWYWRNDPFYASTVNLFLNNAPGDKFQKNTAYASNGEHGHVGNYYNWTAAIASNDSTGYTMDAFSDFTKRPQSSICPKGWRLPTISSESEADEGSTNEFSRLNYLYNNGATDTSQVFEVAPLYFVRAGNISNGGSQFSSGQSGIYLSSVNRDSGILYGFTFQSSVLRLSASLARSGASSLRCVAREKRENYTVSFDANGGSGDMAPQVISTGAATKLSANQFVAPLGKVFAGWTTNSDGTGDFYANEAEVTDLAATGETVTLYAKWGPLDITMISTMQEMTSEVCAATTTGTTATLRDTRDDKAYEVAKLADGKCWMVQNLNLGDSEITLTPADSDVSTNFSIPASSIQTSGATSWSSPVDAVHVYDNGDTWIEPTSAGNDATVNTTGTPDTASKYVGNYYNWYTATAGTGTAAMSSGDATDSICPKGWKLPTGDANSDITALTGATVNITSNTNYANAASFTIQSSPIYFALVGYYDEGIRRQGSEGYWWSSTPKSTSGSQSLYLSTTRVYPQYGSGKIVGISVRCIAE